MKVKRSWGMTIGLVVAGLVFAGGSVWLFQWAWVGEGWRDFVGWPAFVICALFALALFAGAVFGSGEAGCPGCGESIGGLDPTEGAGVPVPCGKCEKYSSISDGKLTLIEESHVADRPIFRTSLPEKFSWPAGCCQCGAPSTREIEMSTKASATAKNAAASAAGIALAGVVGVGFIRTGGGTTYTVQAPHCAAHDGGVLLDTSFGSPVIAFRSLAVLRAFCAANGTKPSPP
jgi:hypothetical protein